MGFKQFLTPLLLGGIGAVLVGFLGGVGADAWTLVREFLTNSQSGSEITSEQFLSYIAVIIGIFAIIGGILQNKYQGKFNLRDNQTPESKLNNLIKELQNFNQKWNRGIPLVTTGYRKQILKRTIWNQNPEKIRSASVKIKRKNAQLKELKIKNSTSILNSVTGISDNIAELGVNVENTFLTLRQEKEALEKDPKVFEKFVEYGDNICIEIRNMIFELEKLRTHIL